MKHLNVRSFFIEIGCQDTSNVDRIVNNNKTEKLRNLKLENPGGCVFNNQLKMACARNFNA